MTRLITPRLVLRGFVEEDEADLVALDADPAVMEFLDPDQPLTRQRAAEWIADFRAHYEGDRGFWAAEEDGRFIGWFHLRPARDTGELELGYRLRREAWGRGLATEGSRALLTLARERVIARTMLANQRSRRVMEKLGMTVVRTFAYQEGGPVEDVEYAVDP